MHVILMSQIRPLICVIFKEIFLVMFDQNDITGPAGENDRLLPGEVLYAGLLQSFSQLKPHPCKLAFIFLRF